MKNVISIITTYTCHQPHRKQHYLPDQYGRRVEREFVLYILYRFHTLSTDRRHQKKYRSFI